MNALRERYGWWSRAAWAEVDGVRLPLDANYGRMRAEIRARTPDLEVVAEWRDGVFPPAVLLPRAWVIVVGVGGSALLAGAAAFQWGAAVGGGAAVAGALALARARDRVIVEDEGLTLGPAWAPRMAWHEIEKISLFPSGWRTLVLAQGVAGSAAAWIPTPLLPALRAKIRRQGGLELGTGATRGELRAALWRGPALGMSWGGLLGPLAVAPWTADPWPWLLAGIVLWSAFSMMQAAVEARVSGWGLGAVLAMSALYGGVLVLFGLALG